MAEYGITWLKWAEPGRSQGAQQAMKQGKTFVRETEFRELTVQGIHLKLEISEHVFAPSVNGSFYAQSIRVNPGEVVVDIGTGSGVLAIFAAKAGAVVLATDISPAAIEGARRNALLNEVEIEFYLGKLFNGLEREFDVILANLPNEIIHDSYLENVGRERAMTFDGGKRGNEHILELLKVAKQHMHGRSRLYLPVHTLTDYHETLRYAIANYSARLVAFERLRTKDFVEENIEFYLKLNESGLIQIFLHDEKWHSYGYVFELSL